MGTQCFLAERGLSAQEKDKKQFFCTQCQQFHSKYNVRYIFIEGGNAHASFFVPAMIYPICRQCYNKVKKQSSLAMTCVFFDREFLAYHITMRRGRYLVAKFGHMIELTEKQVMKYKQAAQKFITAA
ncbi:MAG: hypothetical protein WC819_00130 [Parcubacteria group bacterium]